VGGEVSRRVREHVSLLICHLASGSAGHSGRDEDGIGGLSGCVLENLVQRM
jgi:hypothetical protein